jgi:hypothetical protein
LLFSVSPLLADVVCGHYAFLVFTGEGIEIPSNEMKKNPQKPSKNYPKTIQKH